MVAEGPVRRHRSLAVAFRMKSLSQTADSTILSDRESEEPGLLLQVRGGEHGGRRIQLTGKKWTIGSAPSCSLRLQAIGIHPVHCLILRGRKGTVIRSWAQETRLNGEEFDDDWLRPGDRLTVGSMEFEVLQDSSNAEDSLPSVDGAQPSPTDAELVPEPVGLGPQRDAAASPSFQGFEQRLRELLQHQQQLKKREEELDLQCAEHASERKQWSEEREAELAELDAREECLRLLREEIEEARESMAAEREAEINAVAEPPEQWRREFEALRHERDELKELVGKFVRNRADDLSASNEECAPSTASGTMAPLDGPSSQPEQASPSPNQQEAAASMSTAPPATGVPPRESDECSIDDYMSQLLQRVGGQSGPPVEAPAAPAPIAKRAEPKAQPKVAAEVPTPANPSEFVPRTRPAPMDLGALRDVANRTARSAIERHTSRVWLQAAITKWFMAAIAMISLGGLVYWSGRNLTLARVGLVIACLGAVVWFAQAAWLTLRSIRALLAEKRRRRVSRPEASETSA